MALLVVSLLGRVQEGGIVEFLAGVLVGVLFTVWLAVIFVLFREE